MRKTALHPLLLGGALLLAGGFVGCSEHAPPKVDPNAEAMKHPVVADLEHRVGPGETMAIISKWYTGKPTNWSAIKAANPGINPNRLKLGQTIIIPGDMVVRREPIPRSFIKSSGGSTKSAKKAPASVLKTDETPTAPKDTGSEIIEKPIDLGSSGPSDSDFPDTKKPTAPVTVPDSGGSKATLDDLLGDSPSSGSEPSVKSGEAKMPSSGSPKDGGSAPAKPAGGSDAEREKLLDELLSQ